MWEILIDLLELGDRSLTSTRRRDIQGYLHIFAKMPERSPVLKDIYNIYLWHSSSDDKLKRIRKGSMW